MEYMRVRRDWELVVRSPIRLSTRSSPSVIPGEKKVYTYTYTFFSKISCWGIWVVEERTRPRGWGEGKDGCLESHAHHPPNYPKIRWGEAYPHNNSYWYHSTKMACGYFFCSCSFWQTFSCWWQRCSVVGKFTHLFRCWAGEYELMMRRCTLFCAFFTALSPWNWICYCGKCSVAGRQLWSCFGEYRNPLDSCLLKALSIWTKREVRQDGINARKTPFSSVNWRA
jgi:hypothetical protein